MRIIKSNNIERIKKCNVCRTVFAYTGDDVDGMIYPTVTCPKCGRIQEISIFDKKVKGEK